MAPRGPLTCGAETRDPGARRAQLLDPDGPRARAPRATNGSKFANGRTPAARRGRWGRERGEEQPRWATEETSYRREPLVAVRPDDGAALSRTRDPDAPARPR